MAVVTQVIGGRVWHRICIVRTVPWAQSVAEHDAIVYLATRAVHSDAGQQHHLVLRVVVLYSADDLAIVCGSQFC